MDWMPKSKVTSAQILEKTLQVVAPLPGQMDYLRDLATILAMRINRNLLIDEGISSDELPSLYYNHCSTNRAGKNIPS